MNDILENISLPKYLGEVVFQTVPAVVLGLIIDESFKRLQKKWNAPPVVMFFVQLIVSAIILYVIAKLYKQYANNWQSSIPGLYFAAFFFGVQRNLIDNVSLKSDV